MFGCSMTGTRLSTINLLHNPIQHGCNKKIRTKKTLKNYTKIGVKPII